MIRVVKVRIYPNRLQEQALSKIFGCTRWLWNHHLDQTNQAYKETGKGLSHFDMNNRLPKLKKEFEWLSECYSQTLQQVNVHLSRAFINFFEKRAQYPRFKSRRDKQSAHYPQYVQIGQGQIKFPKIGWIKAKIHRLFAGVLKGVTLSMTTTGKYFASLSFETHQELPTPSTTGKAVGIDVNLKDFAVTSEGEKVKHPKHLYKHEKNLKRKQQKLARKQKGSISRDKARQLVAHVHERIANARNDFLHKLSRRLVNENQVICVEDLAVRNMVKNHCLAKAISDSGWSTFVSFLQYKCERAGKTLVKIGRFFPSSKTCHRCLFVMPELPLSIRHWMCPSCKVEQDRDINAALNIREEGLRILLALGTRATADGGEVRPKRGRKSSVGHSPVKLEACPF